MERENIFYMLEPKDCVLQRGANNQVIIEDQIIPDPHQILSVILTANQTSTGSRFSDGFSNNLIVPAAFVHYAADQDALHEKVQDAEQEAEQQDLETQQVIPDSLYEKLLQLAKVPIPTSIKPPKKKTRGRAPKRNKTAKVTIF
jgi:hypothetical protein